MIKKKPYKLINTIKNYKWGTRGSGAFIPKLVNINGKKNKCYAELWMGAHPNASSKIYTQGKSVDLLKVINLYPTEMLGERAARKFSKTLPFLFKVLSINEMLSVQVHPNRNQAIQLHKKDSFNYPDQNEKLEIAVVLDYLEAFIGFKPISKIISTIQLYPEFIEFFGKANWNSIRVKKSIQEIIQVILRNASDDQLKLNDVLKKIKIRLSKKLKKTEIEKNYLELYKKYPNDVGLLFIFLLNLVKLKKGESVYIEPGIPHAYLKGNILECMSNSDNVIRAGITNKYRDFDSFQKVLKFKSEQPKVLKGKMHNNFISYKTDNQNFEIKIYNLSKDYLEFKDQDGPRIILMLKGHMSLSYHDGENQRFQKYKKGDSIFLPAVLGNFRITPQNKAYFAHVSVPLK